MLASLTLAYFFGLLIGTYRKERPKRAKLFTVLSVCVSLSFLLFFKYYNFFAQNFSRLPMVSLPTIAGLALPIGSASPAIVGKLTIGRREKFCAKKL